MMTEDITSAPMSGAMAESTGDHLVEPDNPLPKITIDELPDTLRENAKKAGWSSLTRVQERAIPYLRAGRDMMIQSRTGSGKTGAFVLPIVERIDPELKQCQALVLVPTRELAQQVCKEAERLGGGTGVRSVGVYGGVGYGPQLEGFKKGAHLVVGTAGRILDHLLRRSLLLDDLRVLVFDEADRMMSMGSYPDMKEIAAYLPRNRSSFMFSATFPNAVRRLAGQFLRSPGFLSLSHDSVHVTDTEHIYYECPAMDKDRALVRIIEVENPESAIIFCNTKARVSYLATVLQRFGYDADQITSDLTQKARDRVLDRLRNHELRFLVATDVAARGIDISNLTHVINYEIPDDLESYVHRTGRTGRAGASGVALALVDASEKADLKSIINRFDIEMEPRPVPTHEDVQNIVSQKLVALLEARLRTRDKLKKERMERFKPLIRNLSESDDEIALLAMVLDDVYQESLHVPPPVPAERIDEQGSSKDRGRAGGGRRRRR